MEWCIVHIYPPDFCKEVCLFLDMDLEIRRPKIGFIEIVYKKTDEWYIE